MPKDKKTNIMNTIYIVVILEIVLIAFGSYYFYQNYSFNYNLLLNASIGLLTFPGIFYALIFPKQPDFIISFKKLLLQQESELKSELIKEIKRTKNVKKILDEYVPEFQQINFNRALTNLNIILFVSVLSYIIVIVSSLFLFEKSKSIPWIFAIFLVGYISTIIILSVWLALSIFESKIKEKIEKKSN